MKLQKLAHQCLRLSRRQDRNTLLLKMRSHLPGDVFWRRVYVLYSLECIGLCNEGKPCWFNTWGHITSFSSAATLYDIVLTTFSWVNGRRKTNKLIWCFPKGLSLQVIYARSYIEGRSLMMEQLDNFRREVDGKGILFLPTPLVMPGLLAVPKRYLMVLGH